MTGRKVNLKRFFCLITTILCCCGLILTFQATPSQKEDPGKPKQSHDVSLVLRALKKGQPEASLQQKDFTLYENGKPMPLTGFREIRRKVGQYDEDKDKTTPSPAEKKRLFFLYFQVSESDPEISKTLDYFFSKVYRDGDCALLMLGSKVFPITRRSQVETVLESFNTTLDLSVQKTRQAKQKLTDSLEQLARQFFEENWENLANLQRQSVNLLISQFKVAWQEYQQDYIFQAQDKLKDIADSLKKLDIEKWGFVFYQQDRFPSLKLKNLPGLSADTPGRFRRVQGQLERVVPQLGEPGPGNQTGKDFQQAFIEANVTFNLLLSHSTSTGEVNTLYVEYKAAQTDWQRAFRDISQATGGSIIEGDNWQGSLARTVETEDVFYHLTYAPGIGGDEDRKIRIQTNLPGINLQYHRQATISPADKIAIDRVSFNHPLLEFTLKNYRQFFDGTSLYGEVEVRVTTVDANGNQRTLKKILEPLQDEVEVSMNLDFPAAGDYSLIIEANDRQAEQTVTVSQPIVVPQSDFQLEQVLVTEAREEMTGDEHKRTLDSLLKKSALYCQKLRQATFYFTCIEEVIDSHWYRGDLVKEAFYRYDYQIIREENGEMAENRQLKPGSIESLEKKKKEPGKTKDKEKETIVTNFFSSYPYLMPIGMLAAENQSKYRYRLLGRKTSARRTLYKVSVEPKEEGVMIKDSNYGVAWIDEEDGSVYKIELDANSLDGFQQIIKLARQRRHRLKVTDVHWYEVKRKGIRFPSRTEIICSFLDWDEVKKMWDRLRSVALEQVGTVFAYNKYRFFDVNVDVVETDHQ